MGADDADDADDDTLLSELRRAAARIDPPPLELEEAARAALGWRRVEREVAILAELVYDSAGEEPVASGSRSDGAARLLTFEADEVGVEVEAAPGAGAGELRLVGRLVPPRPGRVEVDDARGALTAEADEAGRFRVEGVASGPVSLRCRLGTGDIACDVVTDWLTL